MDAGIIMENNIKKIRSAKGISQRELASLIKSKRGGTVTGRWIGRLESGKESLPAETLNQIADALGVTVALLLKRGLKSIPLK